jgi:hypothetical protein
MQIEGRVQARTDMNAADGTITQPRLGQSLELFTSDARARYADAVRRGNVYVAANQAARALSLNSTTATGLILNNPFNSTVNLVLIEVCVALATAPAGAATLVLTGGLQATTPTGTTAESPSVQSALLGSVKVGQALATRAATIATANIIRAIGGGPVATSSITPPFIRDEIAGAIIMPPGTIISLQCLTTAISAVASFTWEEVPF